MSEPESTVAAPDDCTLAASAEHASPISHRWLPHAADTDGEGGVGGVTLGCIPHWQLTTRKFARQSAGSNGENPACCGTWHAKNHDAGVVSKLEPQRYLAVTRIARV